MNDKDLDGPPERMASAMPSLAQARETSESHPAELNRILRSASWRIIDIRPAHSFRNGHYDDSIHLPGDTWRRCPYLLPPRRRRICVLAGTEDQARAVANALGQSGWAHVCHAVVPESGGTRNAPSGSNLRTGRTDLSPASELADSPLRTGAPRTVLWEPAPWLAEIAGQLPKDGDALDLACGSGRDAVWLASLRRGMVYGVDILPDALLRARALRADARAVLAARSVGSDGPPEGVNRERAPHLTNVRFHQADLTSSGGTARWLAPSRWNVVLVFRYLDRALLPRIEASLRPGGHLVYQTFLVAQRERKGSPRSDNHLLKPRELETAFRSLEILRYEEGDDEEGNVFASLWARRPESASAPPSAP
ncbi:MAG: hypothetical protein KDA27_09800 [Candidatus Eisenbacteria bacterium]|uniref:Rhodanese domain-containing protein n=1 Tax=Eiseniibacteriota bacterium TaxID=2212470 RepID=A0A956NBF5_UNCEI|nr:hypothetical protein [Candidatus Eisenbacteria bacterium]MCB9465760.1 hypothetical protein [Candidatus Eisenbacteria bacterium]